MKNFDFHGCVSWNRGITLRLEKILGIKCMERRWEKATGGLRSLGGEDIVPTESDDQKYPCRRVALERREMGIW